MGLTDLHGLALLSLWYSSLKDWWTKQVYAQLLTPMLLIVYQCIDIKILKVHHWKLINRWCFILFANLTLRSQLFNLWLPCTTQDTSTHFQDFVSFCVELWTLLREIYCCYNCLLHNFGNHRGFDICYWRKTVISTSEDAYLIKVPQHC